MSITWYKLKIKKQSNEYECYIRFKFDFQMQTIRIKAFLYKTDSEGNIALTDKKNKLGYDPRILGSLTVEKNFLKKKRKNSLNSKEKYFEVMKYQGNFNICNLPLIDDYFRNGKSLIYQYEDLIKLMNNKRYKIQISQKKFTIVLDVENHGNIYLNLYNKLEEVEKQELIFLEQNEEALCHRYSSNNLKENQNDDEIEIIENKNFNKFGGRIFIGSENKENINIDEKENEDKFDDYLYQNEKDEEENSDDSSVYDSNLFLDNDKNENSKNKNKLFSNIEKDLNLNNNNNINNKNVNPSCKVILGNNQKPNINNFQNGITNFNNNYNKIINNDNNSNNYNNLFIQLQKESNNINNINNILSSNSTLKINFFQNENSETESESNSNNKKELNFFEKAKNIVNKFNIQKDNNNINNNQEIISLSTSKNNIQINNNLIINTNNNFNLLCTRIISQKANDSLIANEEEKKILLSSTKFDSDKYNLNLLYKASLHGDDKNIFHNRCDNIKNLFLIILTLDNQKFGFYTSVGLSIDKKIIYDNDAFLFKWINEEMDCFHIKKGETAFYGFDDYVLYLGGEQLIIMDKFLNCASSCGLKMQNFKINNNYQINNGNKNFIIKELEAYNISEI